MTKEQALIEYETFCKQTLAQYPLTNGNTIINMANRLSEFADTINATKDILHKKANILAAELDKSEIDTFLESIICITQNAMTNYFRYR
jgi:hypothetical protein